MFVNIIDSNGTHLIVNTETINFIDVDHGFIRFNNDKSNITVNKSKDGLFHNLLQTVWKNKE